jgi:hypothetical protein
VTGIPRSRKDDPTIIPDNPNWHRFKMACPFYRERWIGDEVLEGRTVLYHVICLQNTPPATIDEQQCCLESRTSCWRLRAKRRPRADAEPAAATASVSD